jgi:hypothetical protein
MKHQIFYLRNALSFTLKGIFMNQIVLLLVFAVAFTLSAETRIKGDLTGMNLDESGNPFIVEQDIIVPNGQKVSIKEGCIFLFNPFTGLQVQGELTVNGSQEKPVVFTSIYDSKYNQESPQLPNPFDWNGILVARESENVNITNFELQYSVYGIKSQNPGIKIQNGMFKQNGQFHFTVMDKIQFVQDNISYSFNQQELDPGTGDTKGGAGKGNGKNDKHAKKTSSKGVKIFRFVSLGVGTAGLITGVVFGAQIPEAYQDCNEEANQPPGNTPVDNYGIAVANFNKKLVGTIIGGSVFAIGITGFAVSFAF